MEMEIVPRVESSVDYPRLRDKVKLKSFVAAQASVYSGQLSPSDQSL